jgi:4a-hydroxytetrahydrobiopterin dehydratase
MGKRDRLLDDGIGAFVVAHPGWEHAGDRIERTYSFPDYSAAVGFVMRIALAAERHDHHPDLSLSWGKVRVAWSTHDAGGVTPLDLELAELTDRLYPG